MLNLSTVEARTQFADLINRVAYGKERVVLTRRGKALVAVVPLEDLQQIGETEVISNLSVTDPGTAPWLANSKH